MDMGQFTKVTDGRDSARSLREHAEAIRSNQVEVALMMLYLAGYEVELNDTGRPRASAAKEVLDELGYEAIPVWSCSTKAGGIWETWQRDALKHGDLDATPSWGTWCLRRARALEPA